MSKFLTGLGRVGHVALQLGILAANGYVAYLQGGRVGAINAGIAAVQVLVADQALKAQPPSK